jgi:exosortase
MNLTARWKIILLLAIWAITFFPIVPTMVEAWFDHSDNAHAFLVPFIALYFTWEKREALGLIQPSGSFWGWLLLTSSLAIYILSYAAGIAFFSRLMLISSLVGLLWCCLGRELVRTLAFPLGFLLFMVPVPETVLGMVSFPLQILATKLSAGLIRFCSIPVYREGNMLYFVQTQLEVAEACSGIRSIMALTMLSVIFAHLSEGGWRSKIILFFSAIPIAMFANILRVSGTGILANFFGGSVARGFLHEFSGLVVFALGLGVLFAEFSLLDKFGRKRHRNPYRLGPLG